MEAPKCTGSIIDVSPILVYVWAHVLLLISVIQLQNVS